MCSGRPTIPGEGALHLVHEVNQPLAAILTNAESALRWLTREPANLDEAKLAIERIIGNSQRARDLVKSVRDSAEISPPSDANVDINSLVNDILGLASLDISRHRISVETAFSESLEPIRGDRGQLERVVANLISNGVDAMSAVKSRQRKLRIRTQINEHGDVLAEFEDSGTGLDPGKIDRIFDPLYTTKREGMGLGLSICRSIVEAHGGRIWAAPNRPDGSIFRFSIPIRSR